MSGIAAYVSEALSNALSQLTGTVFEGGAPESGEVERREDPIVWRQSFSVADGACLWLIAGRDLWEAVGRMAGA